MVVEAVKGLHPTKEDVASAILDGDDRHRRLRSCERGHMNRGSGSHPAALPLRETRPPVNITPRRPRATSRSPSDSLRDEDGECGY